MPVTNPKARLISFRLSEHEYSRLQTFRTSQGARSLADLVRASVSWALDYQQNDPGSIDARPLRTSPSPTVSLKALLRPSEPCPGLPLETLATVLLELQVKAESLGQEINDLRALLRTPAFRTQRSFDGTQSVGP